MRIPRNITLIYTQKGGNKIKMFCEFYRFIARTRSQCNAYKNGGTLSAHGWFKWFLNFIWQISFICSCLIYSYIQFNRSFLNFDVKLIFKIFVLTSFVAFIALAIDVHLFDTKDYWQGLKEDGLYASKIKDLIISAITGTLATALLGLVSSIMLELDKIIIICSIGLCLQIPYLVTYIIEISYIQTKYVQFYVGEIDKHTYYGNSIKSGRIENIVIVVLELAMLAFVVYFGIIPLCQGGGLKAITEKGNEIFGANKNILFGVGGIVGAVVAILCFIVNIVVKFRTKQYR